MFVYFAISLVVLLGFCGLAIDVGRMEARSVQLQTAADEAAMAYAVDYGLRGNVSTSVLSAAANGELTNYATNNGIPTPTMTIQNGASAGPFVNNSATVQTTVQQSIPTILLRLLSSANSSFDLSRTAVAAMPPCSTVYTSLVVTSSSTLTLACPLAVGTTLSVDGSSSINGHVLVAGAAASSTVLGSVIPAPNYGWPSEEHPFSATSFTTLTGCTAPNLTIANQTTTISPGNYCAASITNSTVTLNPGVYGINGGITITNSTIRGGPITMSLTNNPPQWTYGQFILTGSQWNVNGPTTTGSGGTAPIVLVSNAPDVPGAPAMVIANSTFLSDGAVSFGAATVSITNSVMRDAGHTFRFSVYAAVISGSQITTSNDYSQLAGGGVMAFTTPLLQ